MGRIVTLGEAHSLPTGQVRDWVYNCLDVTGTLEVAEVLLPRLDEQTAQTYAFERACQNPAFAIMRRGVLVDVERRKLAVKELARELHKLVRAVNKLPLIRDVWDGTQKETGLCPDSTRKDSRHVWPKGEPDETRKCSCCGTARIKPKPFNPNAAPQVAHLLYDLYRLPPQRNKKGEISADEDVLEKVARKWPAYTEVVEGILAVRDVKKQLGFLSARLTPSNRFPSSANVGTAWTGRWSASKNPYGWGSNLQNIAERHRHIFLADAGYRICYADLEQAESNGVAHLSGDEAYIEAHRLGDPHTYVCRLLWPELDWTGDLAEDKLVAKQNPPWDQAPGHDYRFQAKRCQHGSNYGLTPQGIALIAHIPLKEARAMYFRYFDAFPGIRAWQNDVRRRVREGEALVNPFGRKCRLFGRPWDEHTQKQGLAFLPQSLVADILNLALWRVWHDLDPKLVQLLAQVHDAILCQYPAEAEAEAVRALLDRMTIPVPILGVDGKWRTMTIRTEAAAGKNWGKRSKDNPNGLETVHV